MHLRIFKFNVESIKFMRTITRTQHIQLVVAFQQRTRSSRKFDGMDSGRKSIVMLVNINNWTLINNAFYIHG